MNTIPDLERQNNKVNRSFKPSTNLVKLNKKERRKMKKIETKIKI